MKIKTSVVVVLLGCILGSLALTGCSPDASNTTTPPSTNMPSTNMSTNMPSTNMPAK